MTGVDKPDAVFVWRDAARRQERASRSGQGWAAGPTEVVLTPRSDGRLAVDLLGPDAPVACVALRWQQPIPTGALVLGDAFERSYGDLEWHVPRPERSLFWYWLANKPGNGDCIGMGVAVRPGAFCSWTVDSTGVTLWLDVRNGSGPVLLGSRALPAAVITRVATIDGPWRALRELVALLATEPLKCGPLVGSNNWYYAYGKGFDRAAVLRDADLVADLADGHPVRPYCVVDDGWQEHGGGTGGPWTGGRPGVFDDMPDLADQVAARGVLPGIWFRPLLSRTGGSYVRPTGPAFALDPSHPAALERVVADVRRLVSWGFRLLKHDFSTYDFLGHFGAHGPLGKPRPSWRLSDPGLTNAEALLRFYRVLRDAAGDAILLGCNTVGHLAAGLVEAQRTGDDTSGRDWERTRRMGVNTLAYRLPQHGRFFTLDADCVPATPQTPWSRNREFLDLVARSGTALFVSVDPSARTPAVDRDLREAFKIALDGGEPGGVRPLDWQESPASRRWAVGETTRSYDWTEPWGASPIPM